MLVPVLLLAVAQRKAQPLSSVPLGSAGVEGGKIVGHNCWCYAGAVWSEAENDGGTQGRGGDGGFRAGIEWGHEGRLQWGSGSPASPSSTPMPTLCGGAVF